LHPLLVTKYMLPSKPRLWSETYQNSN
jgi:hypothetical protein